MLTQQSEPQLIPLNRLVPSKRNVRKTNRAIDIEALAASIKERGLLQNLCVTPFEGGKFEVHAGGRRLAALKLLAKKGEIAKDFAVLCQLGELEDAQESSLTENVHRVAMDVMDEVEAFAALIESGALIDDVARRYGCTHRHIEQRMALAKLSPKLKNAYRRGDLSLDAARAFCLVDDHAKQEAVFKLLGRPVTHSASVRAHLTEGQMRANDRLVRYVTIDVYEAAGGVVLRDLFQDNEAYIQDPALLTQLVNDKLDGVRSELLAQGWSWATINLGHGRFEGAGSDRVYPTRRSLTKKETKALNAMDAELQALDEALEVADSEDTLWDKHDALTARREALMSGALVWDAALMAHSGVVLSIDYEGKLSCSYGIVARQDVAKIRAIQNQQKKASDTMLNEDGETPLVDDAVAIGERVSSLPKALIRDLSEARTKALRLKISQSPDLALALAVFALARATFGLNTAGLSLSLRPASLLDHEEVERQRGAFREQLPRGEKAVLDWVFAQNPETLLECLAFLVAGAIDLTHEGNSEIDRWKQICADKLASATGLDMREFWSAEPAFWSRLPKSALLETMQSSDQFLALSEDEQAAWVAKHSKLSKSDLLKAVDETLAGSGYLPDMLIAPIEHGQLCLTQKGEAALIVAAE